MPRIKGNDWDKELEHQYDIKCASGREAGTVKKAEYTKAGRMVITECTTCSLRQECDYGVRISLVGIKNLPEIK